MNADSARMNSDTPGAFSEARRFFHSLGSAFYDKPTATAV
jgi:hypothetical protein